MVINAEIHEKHVKMITKNDNHIHIIFKEKFEDTKR